jgi:hypothetical protein
LQRFELKSKNPIYCVQTSGAKSHDFCLEPIKNQTLKNARLGFRIWY